MLPLARLKDATPPKVFERMTEKRASAAAEQQQQQQQSPAAGAAAVQQGGAAGAQQAGRRGGDVGADQQGDGGLCWVLVQEYLEVGRGSRGVVKMPGAMLGCMYCRFVVLPGRGAVCVEPWERVAASDP